MGVGFGSIIYLMRILARLPHDRLGDGNRLSPAVNPGSVGMPAYRDELPVPHVMEAGAPHARYAVVERLAAGWAAELRAVPYDFEAAAQQAEQHGRAAVAESVRTGRWPVAAAKPPTRIDFATLDGLTAALPPATETSAELVRSMRDSDRY
jgi:hypothetical protein